MAGSRAVMNAHAKDVGKALRPGIVVGIGVVGGVLIGKAHDNPILGGAIGLALAAMVNGVWNYSDALAVADKLGTDDMAGTVDTTETGS